MDASLTRVQLYPRLRPLVADYIHQMSPTYTYKYNVNSVRKPLAKCHESRHAFTDF